MKIKRAVQIAALGIVAVAGLSAEDRKPTPRKPAEPKEAQVSVPMLAVKAVSPRATDPSLTNFEAWSNVVVPAGQLVRLNSLTDWTGSTQVALGLACPSGTSLVNIQIFVNWGLPLANAKLLFSADVIHGADFAFTNGGGLVVSTYGTALQLAIRNTGTADVVCDQLTAYALVH